jgi:hypothetical protein
MSAQTQQVLDLQDTELANAMSELQSDPAKLNSFITQRKTDVYKSVTKEHSDNFQKVYGDFTRASDGTSNILYYHTRNKDLDNTQQAIFSKTKSEANAILTDSQNAKRQFEINEWTSNNKLDTLFFFQLLLIVLTLMAPLLYANKIGMIPQSVYYGVSSLIGIAVVLTLLVRSQYTSQIRDNRLWNRRKFAQMGGPPVMPTCADIGALQDKASAAYTAGVVGIQRGAVSMAQNALSTTQSGLNYLNSSVSATA